MRGVHPLEDRRQADAARDRRRRSGVSGRGSRDLGRRRLAARVALEAPAGCSRGVRASRLARPHVLRLLRGGPGAPDVTRWRRDADLLGRATSDRAGRGDRCFGSARARPGRSRDAGTRRRRPGARDRPVRRRDLSLGRGGARRCDHRRHLRALLELCTSPAQAPRRPTSDTQARAGAAAGLRRHPRLPPACPAARVDAPPDDRRPGRADPRHLAGRSFRRRGCVAACLLRHGPAALPRDADPVHDQRPGRPRGLLRQLSGKAARERRPGLLDRAPVLRPLCRARAARRRNRDLGVGLPAPCRACAGQRRLRTSAPAAEREAA